jgi:hypothetical protein
MLYSFLVFVASIVYLATLSSQLSGTSLFTLNYVFISMRHSPFIWPLALYALVATVLAAMLFLYHILYVVSRLTTTHDIIKQYQ